MKDDAPRRANIELKARCPDRDRALATCRRLGAEPDGTEEQTDTYFSTGAHRMKLRRSSLGRHYMIWYSRPNRPDSRRSSYRLVPVPDPETKARILSQAMAPKAVVKKSRTLYLLGPVRIHVDEVEGLGTFLEFEAVVGPDLTEAEGHDRIARLRREFDIAEEDLIAGSYSDLVANRLPA